MPLHRPRRETCINLQARHVPCVVAINNTWHHVFPYVGARESNVCISGRCLQLLRTVDTLVYHSERAPGTLARMAPTAKLPCIN